MTDPISSKSSSPWLIPAGGSFLTLGLVAELTPEDGSRVCNLPLIGGLGGLPVEPQWGVMNANGFLMALSVVHALTTPGPTGAIALQSCFTRAYCELVQATTLLDDGTEVTPWQTAMANWLAAHYIYPANPLEPLTLPMVTLQEALGQYIRTTWPDAPG
jgi:hypothetical protein